MPEISGSHGLGTLPNNVRYLGQSGDMLTESFAARDPERS